MLTSVRVSIVLVDVGYEADVTSSW